MLWFINLWTSNTYFKNVWYYDRLFSLLSAFLVHFGPGQDIPDQIHTEFLKPFLDNIFTSIIYAINYQKSEKCQLVWIGIKSGWNRLRWRSSFSVWNCKISVLVSCDSFHQSVLRIQIRIQFVLLIRGWLRNADPDSDPATLTLASKVVIYYDQRSFKEKINFSVPMFFPLHHYFHTITCKWLKYCQL